MTTTADRTASPILTETDDRFLQAVQYVLGELSAAEQDTFEAALMDDVSLCALVAEASSLMHATQQALLETASAPVAAVAPSLTTVPRHERWTVAVLAAAASALAAIGLANFSALPPTSVTVRSARAVELVSLWQSAGRTMSGSTAADCGYDSDASIALHDDRVPPWMLAAVSLENRRTRSSLPEASENWEEN